ncbi:MAG: GDP-mannose 4,6-dehydratase [Fibrobacteria bacterium]|nr:GDP-mannose 4,6-dehydratase [Fibrobacteria bacterium]
MKILVTGGCGFIGSHLIDALVLSGHEVISFDRDEPPKWQNSGAVYIKGNVCDNLDSLMAHKFDVIYHLAAEVGSGLSMANPYIFSHANSLGTTNLIQAMRKCGKYAIFIVASSACVYGEASYICKSHGRQFPDLRPVSQLQKGQWEVKCPECGEDMQADGIEENRILNPASIYGITKLEQEVTSLLLGRTWDFPCVAYRFFGVFGPRQSLGNPYTGVLALFATRVFAGLPIVHYEDGGQNKSYIHIDDVIRSMLIPLENEAAYGKAFNIGSEEPVTIRGIAERLVAKINPNIEITTIGKFRASDTRHMWPNIDYARKIMKWKPDISFEQGMDSLIEWMGGLPSSAIKDSVSFFEKAEKYAKSYGLEV